MDGILIQLFTIFSPIVADIIKHHRESNNGADPTDAEMKAAFLTNVDKYLGKGDAWLASHPRQS